MLSLLLAVGLLLPGTLCADDAIQPTLAHLYLGDKLKDVQRIYPPAREQPNWPSYKEPRGHVDRVRVERSYLRKPIKNVDILWLGFKSGRLVEIQLVYDAAYTRANSVDAVATQWSTIYGEPRRSPEGRYWWTDGNVVLRVFSAEIPTGTGDSVELRTSVQVFEQGLFERID